MTEFFDDDYELRVSKDAYFLISKLYRKINWGPFTFYVYLDTDKQRLDELPHFRGKASLGTSYLFSKKCQVLLNYERKIKTGLKTYHSNSFYLVQGLVFLTAVLIFLLVLYSVFKNND
jgi:hypothetical protein